MNNKNWVKVLDIDNNRCRLYKLNRPIRFGKGTFNKEPFDVQQKYAEYYKNHIERHPAPEYQQECDFTLVWISDAHTHAERLVFLGAKQESAKCGYSMITHIQLGGVHTMMIHGGDSSTMRDDEVYLRRLCQLNPIEQNN